jgi:hypothetical protein
MSEQITDPLDRIPGESKRANSAFAAYAMMGSGRSLRNLLAEFKKDEHAPTHSWATISKWSANNNWVIRSELFDQQQREKEKAAYDARREQIMNTGLALTHERLVKLNSIFDQLEKNLKDPNAVWVPDVKSIGQGEFAERVDIVRFNSALFEQARGTLDDIAREVGGRVKVEKVESSVLNLNVNADDMAKARKTAQEYEKRLLEDGDEQPADQSQPRAD